MKAGPCLSASAKLIALTCLSVGAAAANSEPFVPTTDDQVLERVRTVASDPEGHELRRWRTCLAQEPNNAALAIRVAQRCIERSRAEGDPRYLGHAQSALAPWWTEIDAPIEVRVLRATIKQSLHDFPNALLDLEGVVQSNPKCAQAWLTSATILAVLGRYEEARHACLPLVGLAPHLVAITTLANVSSLQGDAERSRQLLRGALDRCPSATASEKLWALTVLAETNERLGHAAEAEEDFRRALALGQRDIYLLGAFADHLLDHNRAAEVVRLLKDEGRVDALLLRLALAEAALEEPPASLASHLAALRSRFDASRQRGDCVHRREEARFELHLRRRPLEALRLAQANWEVQREPSDARILLEAALAAHDRASAMPAIEFVNTNRLEDVILHRRITELKSQHLSHR